jgi:2-polyprenyl-3-methyl-5-hydroxy-6-metoxy-1,4-benzoquinol methylase
MKESTLLCVACGSTKFQDYLNLSTHIIRVCKECSLGITYPAPEQPDYANMDFHSKEKEDNIDNLITIDSLPLDWQKALKAQVYITKSHFLLDANILEIGCGEGILLSLLKEQGFKNLTGIEPSTSAAKRAAKRDLHIINNMFDEVMFDDKFDLIILSHVLEHVPNLLEFIEKLEDILKNNGGILLAQTNYKGIIPTVLKQKWYAWVPEQHYWHFTYKSLSKTFEKFNLRPVTVEYCSLVHPFNSLYKLTYQLSKLFPSNQDQFLSLYKKD